MHFSLDCLRIVLCKSNANELRRISWLFLTFSGNFAANEISANFPRTFEAPIVLVRRNYERYFAADASELRTQEGKFVFLESSVRNFERKFALLVTAKCSPCIVVMHCRNIRNQSHPLK